MENNRTNRKYKKCLRELRKLKLRNSRLDQLVHQLYQSTENPQYIRWQRFGRLDDSFYKMATQDIDHITARYAEWQCDYQCDGGFPELPMELTYLILDKCDLRSQIVLAFTCKTLYTILMDRIHEVIFSVQDYDDSFPYTHCTKEELDRELDEIHVDNYC